MITHRIRRFSLVRRLRGAVAVSLAGLALAASPIMVCAVAASSCGNGILDAGEDCDGGSCCSDGCRFVRVGSACDDRDSCTTGDSCSTNGICIGAPKDCSRLRGLCSSARCVDGACTVVAANEGTDCDDKDACTDNDRCRAGACAGDELDCSALDGPCSIGTCANDGVCRAVAIRDDVPCDDGDACTGDDRCNGGSCTGQPTDCSHLDGLCLIGVCRADGQCDVEPDDGSACDDGDPCTLSDTCRSGQCAGTPLECSHLNDGCVVGFCDETGTCAAREVSEGDACDDGDACTSGDVCSASICAGTALDCSTLDNACSRGSCDPLVGCVAEPINDGRPCVDGDACTTRDTCRAGLCSGTLVDCSELDEGCFVGVCQHDGSCTAEPLADGMPCDDSDPCTIADSCNHDRCIGFPTDCSGLDDACNVGRCGDDGQCRTLTRDNGTPCDDGNDCTIHDECLGGVCIGGGPVDCDDDVSCTQDRCVPTRGCVHESTDANCLGHCTVVEPCDQGPCQSPRHAEVVIVERDRGAKTLLIGAWVPYGDGVPQPQASGLRVDIVNEGDERLLALTLPPDAFEVTGSSIRLGSLEYGTRKQRTLRRLELGFNEAVGSARLDAKLKGRALTAPDDGDVLTLTIAFGATTERTCVQWPPLTCRLTLSTWSANDSLASKRRYSCTGGSASAWTNRVEERVE